MHGRILIADDRFASRLMLAALFSGAYYEVLQIDSGDAALEVARRDHPGIVVISDGLSGGGAARLCQQLRHDPGTERALRIVVTDLSDPARTALLIQAGAHEVIARSCRDEEVLARVRTLVDHRAKISALTLRDDAPRQLPGLQEAAADFRGSSAVTIVSARPPRLTLWAGALRKVEGAPPGLRVRVCTVEDLPADLPDVLLVDAESLGTDATLRLVARVARCNEPRVTQILVAHGPEDHDLGLRALDLGADSLLALPFDAREAAARVTLLLRRKVEITQLHSRLRSGLRSAMTDPLTGLYNRRYALPRLDQFMRDVRAQQHPAALIMADLDRFKWINDTFGHPAGDAVLTAVAKVMREETTRLGFAARMGGEEFLVALPRCGRLAAAATARRIRAAVEATTVPFPGIPHDLRATISVGVAVADPAGLGSRLGPSEDTAALLTRADRALYRAKRAGRNRVVCDLGVVTGDATPPAKQSVTG